jgi:hypothetical protein
MQNDGLISYPYYLSEEDGWTIVVIETPTIFQATVELVRELVTTVGDLKEELLHEKLVNEQQRKKLERLKHSTKSTQASREEPQASFCIGFRTPM